MTEKLLDKKSQIFEVIEEFLKSALKKEIELSEQWEINKEHFEEIWTAKQLSESVIKQFNIKVSDAEVETDFSEEEDIDSLSNCFVQFESIGMLKETLIASGLNFNFIVDIFNDVYGSEIQVGSNKDIENNVNLFKVFIENQDLLNEAETKLIGVFHQLKTK